MLELLVQLAASRHAEQLFSEYKQLEAVDQAGVIAGCLAKCVHICCQDQGS